MNDLKFAFRQLLKNPGFTAVAVLTLALGIGANTAIFSVVHAVLLRPLPYPESERLVRLSERGLGWSGGPISYPNFTDWKAQQTVFEHIGLCRDQTYNLTGADEPWRVSVAEVGADALAALRIQPALGRLFTVDEDKPGGPRVAVLSHAFWRSRFGGDPGVLNKTIALDGNTFTVLGVMPAGFKFPDAPSLWVPVELGFNQSLRQSRGEHPGHWAVARLKPGVTFEQANTAMDTIAARLAEQYPDSNKHRRVAMEVLLDSQVGQVRQALWILLGAVTLVLLIACANVANLLLGRAVARQKEVAVRAALGAGRARIVRQLLTESVLLAAIGGAAGLLLAHGSLRLIVTLGQRALPRVADVTLDAPVLLFSAAIALLTGILFGLAPAWQSSRLDVQDALKDTARSTTAGRGRLRHGLVVAEVALTLMLLVGAGLLLRSFDRLQRVNPGFSYERVLSFRVSLPGQKYRTADARNGFFQALLEQLRALPGVEAASVASQIPLDDDGWDTQFLIEGQPEPPPYQRPSLEVHLVGPDYFRVMGIPVLRGRAFSEHDNREHVRGTDREQSGNAGLTAILIDEEFARRHFPNEDPIGKQIRLPWGPRERNPVMTIIGVAGRVKETRLKEDDIKMQAYFSSLQRPNGSMTVVMKTTLPPARLMTAARQQVRALDPDLPLYDERTMASLRADNIAPERLNLTLLSIFAGLALALAVIGLYGVLAYAVTQRRREIGVRMALGAQRRDVLELVVGHGMKLVLGGGILGLLGAWASMRLLQKLLFEITPGDPVTFAVVTLALCLVALLACYIPARRAANIEPMEALRYE